MRGKSKQQSVVYYVIISLLAGAFIAFPFKNIILGTYQEYLKRTAITEGIIEIALVYIVGVILILTIKNKIVKCVLLLLSSLLYMQNHQFLLPYIVAIFYIEMILSIGTATRKLCGLNVTNEYLDYLSSFVVGEVIWGGFAIGFSLFGKGNFTCLRMITAFLFIISIALYSRKPLFLYTVEQFKIKEKKEQLLIYFLLMIVLIQGAKSCSVLDYDSQWYGLNAENVLVGSNSFYDNLGMLTWVHYFPKFFELFIGPLSDLGEYTFLHAVNIRLYELLIIAVYLFLREMKVSNIKALLYTILVATVPTIANMSTVVKPDIFTGFLVVFSAICFFKATQKNDSQYLLLAYISIILSACGKISSYPYIAILFMSGTMTFIFTNKKNCLESILHKRNIPCFLILLTSIFVFAGTHYRTYVLTGYPIYPFTVNFWKKIGFDGVYPFAVFFGGRKAGFADGTVFNLQFYIQHIFNLVFTPNRIAKYRVNNITIGWYSNFGVFLSCILLYDILKKRIRHENRVFSQDLKILTGLLLPIWIGMILLAVFFFQYAQDGNYYIIPVSLGFVYLANVFENRKFEYKKIHYGIFSVFIISQFLIMFVSHTSWHLGTTEMKVGFFKTSYDSHEKNLQALDNAGIREFEEYITSRSYTNSRALGDGNEQLLFRLSTGFECLNNAIGMTKGIFESEESLIKYLEWAGINFLILPKEKLDTAEDLGLYQSFVNVFCYYQGLENVFQIETEDYILLDITAYTDSENIPR